MRTFLVALTIIISSTNLFSQSAEQKQFHAMWEKSVSLVHQLLNHPIIADQVVTQDELQSITDSVKKEWSATYDEFITNDSLFAVLGNKLIKAKKVKTVTKYVYGYGDQKVAIDPITKEEMNITSLYWNYYSRMNSAISLLYYCDCNDK